MKSEPAYPISHITWHEDEKRDGLIKKFVGFGGLTKREYFAAMAMQGLLANTTDGPTVKQAVLFADAIMAELEKEQT